MLKAIWQNVQAGFIVLWFVVFALSIILAPFNALFGIILGICFLIVYLWLGCWAVYVMFKPT
jgi:hypothetical protein